MTQKIINCETVNFSVRKIENILRDFYSSTFRVLVLKNLKLTRRIEDAFFIAINNMESDDIIFNKKIEGATAEFTRWKGKEKEEEHFSNDEGMVSEQSYQYVPATTLNSYTQSRLSEDPGTSASHSV